MSIHLLDLTMLRLSTALPLGTDAEIGGFSEFLSGLITDVQTLHQRLQFRHKLYLLKEERNMKPETFTNLVSSILYEKRDKDSGLLKIPYLQTDLGRVLRRYVAQIPPNRIETAGYSLGLKTQGIIDQTQGIAIMVDRPDDVIEEVSSSQGQQTYEVGESSRPPQTDDAQLITAVTMFTQVMQNPRFLAFLQPPLLSQQVGSLDHVEKPVKAQAQPRRPNVQQPLHAENGAENQSIGAENQPQEVAIAAPQVGEQQTDALPIVDTWIIGGDFNIELDFDWCAETRPILSSISPHELQEWDRFLMATHSADAWHISYFGLVHIFLSLLLLGSMKTTNLLFVQWTLLEQNNWQKILSLEVQQESLYMVLEPEELFEVISQALLSSVDRDCLSGWGGIVHVVSANQVITRTLKGRMD
ncbi:hypothetical protein L7F22_041865 [Adiantum nelumboides]|nr:hypothetical protein [Adiantum nelumboides]